MASPAVGRRRLALDLRRYRLASGRTIEEVAAHLECSPAKVSRMETGIVKVGPQDLRAILELYGVDGAERDALFGLVRQARARGWWEAYADVVPPGSARFYGLEDGAELIAQHVTSLVPGLLQTEGYARALMGSVPGLDPAVVDRRVELRLRRAALLERPEPPRLDVLLDEAVLRRAIGGPAVFAEQLRHLLAVADRPSVLLRVIEFDAPVHPAVGVSFTVFGFAGDPGGVVFREQLDANGFLDEPGAVATYRESLSKAAGVAAGPARSRELIAARLAEVV
ncbi:helix-turn-helix domain-containing protein [Pseudonocardia sp. CA-107938]|uniref:helix-turn-helix domain-containing protein n=1 Tax=Pseudonocardia sp. CA-107938 TaxID=3240021 RepID=UPI003D8A0E18